MTSTLGRSLQRGAPGAAAAAQALHRAWCRGPYLGRIWVVKGDFAAVWGRRPAAGRGAPVIHLEETWPGSAEGDGRTQASSRAAQVLSGTQAGPGRRTVRRERIGPRGVAVLRGGSSGSPAPRTSSRDAGAGGTGGRQRPGRGVRASLPTCRCQGTGPRGAIPREGRRRALPLGPVHGVGKSGARVHRPTAGPSRRPRPPGPPHRVLVPPWPTSNRTLQSAADAPPRAPARQ